MAKLSKQEVSAIASKLHRELEKSAIEKREQAMKHYVPSETYSKLKQLLDTRKVLKEEKNNINSKICQNWSEINECSPFYVSDSTPAEKVLENIIDIECQIAAVPSSEELRDDVTIAAIDDSFDTASFIQEQLAKFQQSNLIIIFQYLTCM